MKKSRNKRRKIDLNQEFRYALDILENSRKSIFITGRAGTGKSTLLTCFREQTKKKVAVLAPTGVAALNVKGQTIHSFFKFKPGITPNRVKKSRSGNSNIYRNLDIIVIDEVSRFR
jgi:ATP-dependent DNA helicase PIF1